MTVRQTTPLKDFQARLTERLKEASATPDLAARLGLMIGEQRWLVDLSEAGEIVPVPDTIAPVPLTRDWLLGLVNLRGALYTVVVAAVLYWTWQRTATTEGLLQFLQGACLWWVMAFLWILLIPQYGSRFAAVLAGLLVLVPAAIGLARVMTIQPNGNWLLLYLLVLIAAADVGGYFGGRQFGRHKLAPAISPGKTWEGFAAGMLAAMAVAAISAPLFDQPIFAWVALGLLVALISVVGDLVESLFKRKVGLKDSSGLLPGHGGVLDRIDSHTAAAPVFLLGLYALGMVP